MARVPAANDDADSRVVVRRVLQELGHDVMDANDGADALHQTVVGFKVAESGAEAVAA